LIWFAFFAVFSDSRWGFIMCVCVRSCVYMCVCIVKSLSKWRRAGFVFIYLYIDVIPLKAFSSLTDKGSKKSHFQLILIRI